MKIVFAILMISLTVRKVYEKYKFTRAICWTFARRAQNVSGQAPSGAAGLDNKGWRGTSGRRGELGAWGGGRQGGVGAWGVSMRASRREMLKTSS